MISLPLQLTHRWKSVIWLQTICLFWSLFCLFFNLVFSGALFYNEDQKEIITSKYYYNFSRKIKSSFMNWEIQAGTF